MSNAMDAKPDAELVDRLARALGIDLGDEELAEVAIQFQRMAELAQQLDITLADSVELAPRFKAQ